MLFLTKREPFPFVRKRPFKVYLQDEPMMSVAGIWDTRHPGHPGERPSFSILTTAANEFMTEIHESSAGHPGELG